MLRIYLARHGETAWNAERRLQGSMDTPLNERGRAQAAELCERLQGLAFEHIYTSAQRRAWETVEGLRGRAPMTRLIGLNEQRLGRFEGHVMTGEDAEVADEYLRRIADHDDSLDGGESVNQHLARVRAATHEILGLHPSGQILVVAHGATNAAVLRVLFGYDFAQARAYKPRNCEIFVIEVKEGVGQQWERFGAVHAR